jgi:D-alanyl-D-alanine carboxypeptidase
VPNIIGGLVGTLAEPPDVIASARSTYLPNTGRQWVPGTASQRPEGPLDFSPPGCEYSDEPAPAQEVDRWAETLVDTRFGLAEDYVPPDLVTLSETGILGRGQVRQVLLDDLRSLIRAAEVDGVSVAITSAYRSYSRQAEVFGEWSAVAGEIEARRYSARPGHSEHQLGTAVDFMVPGQPDPWAHDFADSALGIWLATHAADFGFVMSYPDGSEGVTCYAFEPWHFRYVGRTAARAIADSGLTLREWLWRLRVIDSAVDL